MRKIAITMDIDWAPDFVIYYCLEILEKYQKKATFFATHKSPINELIVSSGHDLGIHPNFLEGSSHGKSTLEIIEKCLEFAPNAKIMRTHALYSSSPLINNIFTNFKQLKLDVSLFMHRSKFVHSAVFENHNYRYKRLLYNWGDNQEFYSQRYSGENNLFFGDINVYGIHPIHVFLNSTDGSEYKNLKGKYMNQKSINNLTKYEIEEFQSNKVGVKDFLINILRAKTQSIRLEEI